MTGSALPDDHPGPWTARQPDVTGSGTYLYAVTRPIAAQALAGVTGVGGSAVRVLAHAGLHGVVSTVPLAEFGEPALQRNLGDLAWLERTARAHDAVIRAAAELTTTAPLRLATVYHGDGAAEARLGELAGSAGALLDRLDGRVEWGVTVTAPAPSPSVTPAAQPEIGPGAAYLRQRRAETRARERASDVAAAVAEDIYRDLAGAAVAGRRHRPQDPALSGLREPMLLNAAFLVDRDGSDRFLTLAAGLAAGRVLVRVTVTGPWPPYSFAVLEQS